MYKLLTDNGRGLARLVGTTGCDETLEDANQSASAADFVKEGLTDSRIGIKVSRSISNAPREHAMRSHAMSDGRFAWSERRAASNRHTRSRICGESRVPDAAEEPPSLVDTGCDAVSTDAGKPVNATDLEESPR